MIGVDREILDKAASELHHDLGSLRDFPSGLRNTIASLYYEYWWFKMTDDESSGHSSWVSQAGTRMGLYAMVPKLVELIRKTRAENRMMSEMMVGSTRDLLRYNLKDVTRKSAARRAIEKLFRKPFYEVPGIYGLMEYVILESSAQEPSSADLHGSQGAGFGETSASEPDFHFIRELPDPNESRAEREIQHHGYTVSYYRNPRLYGEVVAGISPPYDYPQVAVVEKRTEPMLIVRTEQSVGGTTFICSVWRDGSRHNLGKFAAIDPESFLQRVFAEVSRVRSGKVQPAGDEAGVRAIVNCPSCGSALRVPKDRSGNVRCTVCKKLFGART